MRRALLVPAIVAAVAGCGGDDGAEGGETGGAGGAGPLVIPEHVANEQKSHTTAVEDGPHDAEVVTHFRTTDVLPDLDVRALAVVGGRVYAGTGSGLFVLESGANAFGPVAIAGSGPVVDLAVIDGDQVLVARGDEVHLLTTAGAPGEVLSAGAPVTAVAAIGSVVYAGTASGLSRLEAAGPTPIAAAQGVDVSALESKGDELWIGGPGGLVRYDALSGGFADAGSAETLACWPDAAIRALVRDGEDVLAAQACGLSRIAAAGTTFSLPGPGALPNDDLLAVAGAGDTVLTGHGIGATATTATHVDHYHTERWVPAERVVAVALEPDGTRWLGTASGISRIALVPTTLAEKAEVNGSLTDRHVRMDGFQSDEIAYPDPWDLSGTPYRGDHDNDGLWTEMQVAGWCFAYAATGDEQFHERARKAMDVMLLLFDVPWATFEAQGKPTGFITRSLVRSDEGAVFEDKKTQDNWHLQEFGGQTYYWKDDTSSDEYAGHYFGIPVFYDLCARSDEEKQAIRQRIDRSTRYLVENDYVLVDLDGEPTTHGDWQELASAVDGFDDCIADRGQECAESYGGGGWLNSLEILGHLLAAWHVTGDDWFYEQYEHLCVEKRYCEMIPITDHTYTVTKRDTANHSDHELASLAYFTLLRYEPNPERRAVVVQSLRDLLAHEKPERNLLEIAVYASAIEDPPMDDALRTLREMTTDWREWRYDNSHRRDYEVDPELDRHQNAQFTAVVPYDEMRTFKWNGNPYAIVGGGNGGVLQAPWPWLLPYWMLRYYGALQ
jgi:hypothetical protein